jgi:hypothetical protein
LLGHAWLTAESSGGILWAGSSEGQLEAFAFKAD